MRLGIEVFAKSPHGGLWVGRTAGAFVKKDGTQWVVVESDNGDIFFRPTEELKKVSELYGVK